MTYIDLTIGELMLLHKQGDQRATVCLLEVFEPLMNKYSRTSEYSNTIDADIKNSLMITCLKALNTFDISKYVD